MEKLKGDIRQDWIGKVTHWELRKWTEFYNTEKWYMHKPETVWEN